MKSKDIALIAVIAVISGVISILLSNMLFTSPDSRSTQVEVVTPLQSEFVRPPSQFYNSESINPTQTIQISPGQNPKPIGDQ
jgi:hypothetical protein